MWGKTILIGVFIVLAGSMVDAQNWYKGNLHTHSLWSDGDGYPEMVMDYYKSHGYNFVGLSDHNVFQEGLKFKVIATNAQRLAFDEYLDKYGTPWVDFKMRPEHGDTLVRLKTLDEYRRKFEEKGKFMIFKSEEITSSPDGIIPIHMVATNLKYLIPGQYASTKTGIIQKIVDIISEQRKETGLKTIVQLNHPNFGWAITAADIMQIKGLRFFEVFNGAPSTHNYGNETHDSTEVIWDKVNLFNIQHHRPFLYGLGVDDAHNYHITSPSLNNPCRAWIVVYAPSLDPSSIITAMESGKFYTSTGVVLKRLSFSSKEISLQVKEEEGVTYKIQFIGVRKGLGRAEVLKSVNGPAAYYKLTPEDLFVRAKISSSKPKANISQEDVERAWTQPIK